MRNDSINENKKNGTTISMPLLKKFINDPEHICRALMLNGYSPFDTLINDLLKISNRPSLGFTDEFKRSISSPKEFVSIHKHMIIKILLAGLYGKDISVALKPEIIYKRVQMFEAMGFDWTELGIIKQSLEV